MKNLHWLKLIALMMAALLLSACMTAGGDDPWTDQGKGQATEIIGGTPTTPEEQEEETEEPEVIPDFPEDVQLSSKQAFVYNVNTGKLIAMKGQGEKLTPASTTKLLTILTGMQYLAPGQAIIPGTELQKVTPDMSFAYIKSHHKLSAEQLIEGMMLPSGNDAAYVFSAAAAKVSGYSGTSGSEACDYFAKLMDTYAKEKLGMTNSNFVSVDGYASADHYSTVEDMAKLAIAAYDNEYIRKYCGLKEEYVVYLSGHNNTWYNTNKMLDEKSEYYSPYVKGMKTGSADHAYCLISILEKDGQTYLAGVFTADTEVLRYTDTQILIDWLFGKE